MPLIRLPLRLFALLATGCSTPSSSLILHPLSSSKDFSQKFKQSFACHNDDGSFEFLMIADEADQPQKHRAGAPLTPSHDMPLRQVVYAKLLRLPMRRNIAATSVSNASVEWNILPNSPEHPADSLKQ